MCTLQMVLLKYYHYDKNKISTVEKTSQDSFTNLEVLNDSTKELNLLV